MTNTAPNPWAQFGPPPLSVYPDTFTARNPGDFIDGILHDVRAWPDPDGGEDKPIMDIMVTEAHPPTYVNEEGVAKAYAGQIISMICGSKSLRAVAQGKSPVNGERVRVQLDSMSGQAKNFSMPFPDRPVAQPPVQAATTVVPPAPVPQPPAPAPVPQAPAPAPVPQAPAAPAPVSPPLADELHPLPAPVAQPNAWEQQAG